MKALVLSTLAWTMPLVCSAFRHDGEWPIRDRETVKKTMLLAETPMRLLVDNVTGYVHVTGVAGFEVRMTIHKTIHAHTDSDLQQARSEVSLKIEQRPGTVSAYYDAPWRCNGEGINCHSERRRFYEGSYDMDLEVPLSSRLFVSTVNAGDINVSKTDGDFEITDINGGIRMSEISGCGSVHTLNGPVTVKFARNPKRPCSFKSINRPIDVWFQPTLSADLLFKTFDGQVYSDFDIAPRAVAASVVADRHGGKFVYHSNRLSGGRAEKGGAELSFDTFNGSIRLHREK